MTASSYVIDGGRGFGEGHPSGGPRRDHTPCGEIEQSPQLGAVGLYEDRVDMPAGKLGGGQPTHDTDEVSAAGHGR